MVFRVNALKSVLLNKQCHASTFALLENGKMPVKVIRDNTVFVNEVFANGRALFSVFSRVLVRIPETIDFITCITQVTLKFINYTLLVNNRGSCVMQVM